MTEGTPAHGDDGSLDIDGAAFGNQVKGDIVAKSLDLDFGERGRTSHFAGGFDAEDLDEFVVEVDRHVVYLVEGEALTEAVE